MGVTRVKKLGNALIALATLASAAMVTMPNAEATSTIYSDPVSWSAAANSPPAINLQLLPSGISYTSYGCNPAPCTAPPFGSNGIMQYEEGGIEVSTPPLTIAFATPIYAFAADFSDYNNYQNPLEVTLSDGEVFTVQMSGSAPIFVGFVSSSPISSVAVVTQIPYYETDYLIVQNAQAQTLTAATLPYGFFATSATCSSTGSGAPLSLSGGVTVDGYSSANGGTYASTVMPQSGLVGTNGSVVLAGGAHVGGNIYVQNTTLTGTCPVRNLFASKGTAYGGVEGISAYMPPTPSIPAAGTVDVTLSGGKSQTLAPGSYHDVLVDGGGKLTLKSPGTFNINCLQLSGGTTVSINPVNQPVVVNVTGSSCPGEIPVNLSGGSISNPSGTAANFVINYAGAGEIKLSGGTTTYVVVNAPAGQIDLTGGAHLYGGIVGNTITDSGGVALHFDTALQ